MADSETPVTVTATHNPFAFLLPMTKFVIAVDGAEQEGSWGARTVAVTPGRHTLRMWFRYLGKPCGVSEVAIDVVPGATTTISYRAPLFVFSAGKTKVEQ